MSDFAAKFQRLADDLAKSSSQEADLLLLQLGGGLARRMRLCAIPHTFDATVLRVLDPSLDPLEAEETLQAFQELPAIMHLTDCLALHDVVRRQFFMQWLAPECKAEFTAASRRLAEFFRPQPEDSAVARGTKEHSRLFHLLGADLAEGFSEFQRVYDDRRKQGRFSDCEALIRLLREYESILDRDQLAWIAYYQAEVAIDSRDWRRAREGLERLLSQEPPSDLRSKTLLRLASVLRLLRRFDEARKCCEQALELAESLKGSGAPARLIHNELGSIARDEGKFDDARRHLEWALGVAQAEGDRLDTAVAYNTLGTLLLRPLPQEATKMFEQSLRLMDPQRDSVRVAQLLNNLAMASANAGDWEKSESFYQQSLQMKRSSGDSYGQALTLLNIARVYQAQTKTREARSALSESADMFETAHHLRHAAEAHRELARLMRGSKTGLEADMHAQKAVELFQRAGDAREAKVTKREFRHRTFVAKLLRMLVILTVLGTAVYLIGQLLIKLDLSE
jgi:tetratricopeptide (TPR) repeat protein